MNKMKILVIYSVESEEEKTSHYPVALCFKLALISLIIIVMVKVTLKLQVHVCGYVINMANLLAC